jgi:hypothetical protein
VTRFPERAVKLELALDLTSMRGSTTRTEGRRVLAVMVALAGVLSGSAGCEPSGSNSDRLVVATSWPPVDRLRLESEFPIWSGTSRFDRGHGPVRIEWLILDPGEDLVRVVQRRSPPDVLLGGPASSFVRLARRNRLSPLPLKDSPLWSIARQATIGLMDARSHSTHTDQPRGDRTSADPAAATPNHIAARDITFDDPRSDPISLAWASSQLEDGPFHHGYSRLVHAAAHPRRIGHNTGAALAAVQRGEAGRAPIVTPDAPSRPIASAPQSSRWIEGVAIPLGARQPELAKSFVQFLTESQGVKSVPGGPEIDPDTDALLADLLGATLVDAQDELWAAWAVLDRVGYPEMPLRWMTEPPPWPPASVARILRRGGESGMPLIETLARELSSDPAVRAWLVRSWLSPPRIADKSLLADLVHAVEGRLCSEPRFRAWLRAEWTAWARQRYRRAARVALKR